MGNSASSHPNPNDGGQRSGSTSRRQSQARRSPSRSNASRTDLSNGLTMGSQQQSRNASPHVTHHSLRQKKKSIDLPDLANLNVTSYSRQSSRNRFHAWSSPPPKSQPIPISMGGDAQAQNYFGRNGREQSEISLDGAETATHIPLTMQRQYGDVHPESIQEEQSLASVLTPEEEAEEEDEMNYGTYETIGASNVPAPPPSRNHSMQPIARSSGYQKTVVHSSIPQPAKRVDGVFSPVIVRIVWSGGGDTVHLARAGDDDDWLGRKPMIQDLAETALFRLTVPLLPGTHHIRFLVDGQWRVSDDLPKAVDVAGSLANYISVGIDGTVIGGIVSETSDLDISTPIAPTHLPHNYTSVSPPYAKRNTVPGQSFWSASSTADGDDPSALAPISIESERFHQASQSLGKRSTGWTDIIPIDLIEAANEEDIYLQATAAQQHQGSSGTRVINGFIPPPAIPPAPTLPRHLEKLILNTKSYPVAGNPSTPTGKETKKSSKKKERDTHSSDGLPVLASTATTPTTKIMDDTIIGDDTSVLPVPSHVVLHHLSTSAIKNGVLAVGETVRYREKFLTTVYYKPTEV